MLASYYFIIQQAKIQFSDRLLGLTAGVRLITFLYNFIKKYL